MFRFKNEKGLTLIELLITISVLAVVSAIALPVINNVVTSSNSNALTQTIKDADDFIAKYSKSGVVLYDGLRTLSGYVDADGDNVIDAGEKIDTLTLADKYAMSATGSASVGGSYTAGGVASVSITGASASTGTPTAPAGFTTTLYAQTWDQGGGDFGGTGSCNWASGNTFKFYCGLSTNAQTALSGLQAGDQVELSFESATGGLVSEVYTISSVDVTSGTPRFTVQESSITMLGDFKQMRL